MENEIKDIHKVSSGNGLDDWTHHEKLFTIKSNTDINKILGHYTLSETQQKIRDQITEYLSTECLSPNEEIVVSVNLYEHINGRKVVECIFY